MSDQDLSTATQLLVLSDKIDQDFVATLRTHLALPIHVGQIDLRDRSMANDWENIDDWLRGEVGEADAVLVMVSPELFSKKERLDDIAVARDLKKPVIPIWLRSVPLEHTGFAGIKGIPDDGKFISLRKNADEAWAKCAEALGALAKALKKNRPPRVTPVLAAPPPVVTKRRIHELKPTARSPRFPWHHRRAVALWDALSGGYDKRKEIEKVAGVVRFDLGNIDIYQGARNVWRDILERAFKSGELHKLVEHALTDPDIAGFHTALQDAVTPDDFG